MIEFIEQGEKLLPREHEDKYKELDSPLLHLDVKNEEYGYYPWYYIGTDWINKETGDTIMVTPKMENIDFLKMFMAFFSSGLESESFSKIYSIKESEPTINAPTLKTVLSQLLIVHFICVVDKIKRLKKGYIHHSENLKKVKGRINVLKNERANIAIKRFDRIFCEYDEYSVDIPENRLIKKALLYSKYFIFKETRSTSFMESRSKLAKSLAMFENVSENVEIRDVQQIKGHKLFAEYSEAIRLAKIILRHFDYSISKTNEDDGQVLPFYIDMSKLYEYYVLGLLHEAYGDKIKIEYQHKCKTGDIPDVLLLSKEFPAILDTKYKPQYGGDFNYSDSYRDDVRQLSGYSRNKEILGILGSDVSNVPPCVIIYPEEGDKNILENPFKGSIQDLKKLCEKRKDPKYLNFYKICVPLPVIKQK